MASIDWGAADSLRNGVLIATRQGHRRLYDILYRLQYWTHPRQNYRVLLWCLVCDSPSPLRQNWNSATLRWKNLGLGKK